MSTAASKDVKRWCGNRHLSLIRPPVQRALLWSLPSFCFFSLARAEAVAEMCHNIADDLGASSCTEVLNENGKGFRLVGTLEQPLRFNDMGFDDNMVGLSAGSQSVCMLAAFGNGGVVPQNCVPIIGAQADEFNGSPEQHYFGMEGFDCGYNFMPFAEGSTISWSFPLGNSCISDADLDLGLTSLYCHFQMSCELGSTTTTTGPETTISSTSTFVTSTISTLTLTTRTATNTYTSATTSMTEVTSTSTSTLVTTAASTRISTAAQTSVQLVTTQATEESTTQSTTVLSTAATTATSATSATSATTATTAAPATVATTAAPSESSTVHTTEGPVEATGTTTTSTPAVTFATTETTTRRGSTEAATLAPSTTSTISTQAVGATTSEIAGNSSCDDLPRIPNSQSLAHCLGVASGLFCPVSCLEGYAAAEDILFCYDGIWQARGECILEGASVTTESAAQVILRMNLTIEESGESSSLEWAEQNKEALHVAFANSLGAHPSEIRVDVLPPGAAGRRLLAQLAFDVRITWLLGDANTTNRSSDVAVQELALLADAEGMSRFGEALQSELNGTDSHLAGVAVEALSTEVIDSYSVPEASWILGPWDTTACDAGCEGAMEVVQLSCSRGSWLLCSGIDKPSTERPCRQCGEKALAMPSWILPTALCVGFCCCGLLGACLARHFMPNLLSRVMQPRQSESENLRNANPKANVLSVDGVNSDPDDMAVIKHLSTIRPTLTRGSSRCREAGVTIEEEDEVQPAKTRVIWDLDLKKISSGITGMFSSKKYSSHVTPESRKASKAPCSPPGAPCCVSVDAEIDEADLENPVAMEPSWVSAAGEVRMPVPVLSRSERSLRSQHSKGTLLNAPCGTPVKKSEAERTLKRTIL